VKSTNYEAPIYVILFSPLSALALTSPQPVKVTWPSCWREHAKD